METDKKYIQFFLQRQKHLFVLCKFEFFLSELTKKSLRTAYSVIDNVFIC